MAAARAHAAAARGGGGSGSVPPHPHDSSSSRAMQHLQLHHQHVAVAARQPAAVLDKPQAQAFHSNSNFKQRHSDQQATTLQGQQLSHHGVLQRPKQWPPQRQQQQQQQQQHIPEPPPGLVDAAAAGGSHHQQQQQPSHAQLSQAIAACTTLHQLQQLFPQVAAAGLPESTTVLLLQAVTIVRSGSSNGPLQPVSSRHNNTTLQQQQAAASSSGSSDASLTPPQLLTHSTTLWPAQHQQQQCSTSEEVQQLLLSVSVLLERQCPLLQFQHISGVLWAWSQLRWRPAEGKGAGIGLRSILRRLVECPVGRELSGHHAHVGPQLARLLVGCAALNISDRHVWRKLYSITQGAAPALGARDLAHCAWAFARSRMPHTPQAVAAWGALLARAQALTAAAAAPAAAGGAAGSAGLDRVAALNLLWAVVSAQLSFLAPAAFLGTLVQQALGHSYLACAQQQQQQQQGLGHSTSSSSVDWVEQAGQQPAVGADLLPQELSCLVWTLAAATKQQQELAAARRGRQLQQQQQGAWGGPANTHQTPQQRQQQQQQQEPEQQHRETAHSAFTPAQLQQLQQLKEGWSIGVLQLLQDSQLQGYLAAAVQGALQQLQLPQLAQLAYSSAVLAGASGAAAAAAAAAPAGSAAFAGSGFEVGLVQQLWSRVLHLHADTTSCSSSRDDVRLGLVESSLLLQSVVAVQQQRRQHQQLDQSSQIAAAGADIVAAAVQCIKSAQSSELQPRTAAVLLHHLAALHRVTAQHSSSSSSSCLQAGVAAAVSASTVQRLVEAVCAAGGISRLKDHELVLAAVAAGQLATASQTHGAVDSSSQGGDEGSRQWQALEVLLQQLALPLAAVAPKLKLRSLANVACAYAAVGLSPPELFDAVADAAQDVRVLDQGSSWALARTLAAYAAVGYVDEGLFAAVADALSPRLRAGLLQPRVVSKLAGALAAAGCHDRSMFKELAAAVVAAAAAPHGSSSSSGPAAPGPPAAAVAAAAAAAAGCRAVLESYTGQDVSVLAWALATAGVKDPRPFQVLAAAGVELLPGMSTGQVANLLWGCAAAGVPHQPLLAAVLSQLVQPPPPAPAAGAQEQQQHEVPCVLAAASAADVATIAWSLAKLHAARPDVLAVCAQHFVLHAPQYSPADAADLAWALAWQQQSRPQAAGAAAITELPVLPVLQVCVSDVDQLSPQQLVDMCLVVAASSCQLSVQAAGSSNSSGSSSSSSRGLRSISDQLWDCVTAWGPFIFSAADGAKLLWANLLTGQQQEQRQELQQPPQQQPSAGGGRRRQGVSSGAGSARAKLLAAGARALVHQTSAVCSSAFAVEVLSALEALQLEARPCIQPQQQLAAAGSRQTAKSTAVAATAAAAAAAAAAVTAALSDGAPAAAVGVGGVAAGSGSNVSASRTWALLGPEAAAQLLGHIVVDSAPEGALRPLLLHLVPEENAGQPARQPREGAAAAWQQPWCWRTAVAARVLQQQPHYVGVVLTQQQWDAWGDYEQKLQKLQALLAGGA